MVARRRYGQKTMRMATGINVVPHYGLTWVYSISSGMDGIGISQRDWRGPFGRLKESVPVAAAANVNSHKIAGRVDVINVGLERPRYIVRLKNAIPDDVTMVETCHHVDVQTDSNAAIGGCAVLHGGWHRLCWIGQLAAIE